MGKITGKLTYWLVVFPLGVIVVALTYFGEWLYEICDRLGYNVHGDDE